MKAPGRTFGIRRAKPVTSGEPELLASIRAAHPSWQIRRVEGEVWQALRQGNGWEHAVYRQRIDGPAGLKAALDLIAEDKS